MSRKRTRILRQQFEQSSLFQNLKTENKSRNSPVYKNLWRKFKKRYK